MKKERSGSKRAWAPKAFHLRRGTAGRCAAAFKTKKRSAGLFSGGNKERKKRRGHFGTNLQVGGPCKNSTRFTWNVTTHRFLHFICAQPHNCLAKNYIKYGSPTQKWYLRLPLYVTQENIRWFLPISLIFFIFSSFTIYSLCIYKLSTCSFLYEEAIFVHN